jgi:hypothetical protein
VNTVAKVHADEEVIDLDDVVDEDAVKNEEDVSNSAEMVRSCLICLKPFSYPMCWISVVESGES